MSKKTDDNWWEEFFDSDFAVALLDRENDPTLVPTADFLISALDLKVGDTVFDQCCGTGAVSRALAAKGIQVTGIDQAANYIARAQRLSKEQGLGNVFFEAADAFKYVTPVKQDAAFNWYTSFGYTPDDTQNIEMLNRVRQSLKPGGRFGLDYMNALNILANFKPVFIREQELNGEKIIFEKHTTIDDKRGMIGSRWVYKFPDGSTKEASGESRLYMPEDLKALLEKAGFIDVTLQGGMNGEACNEKAERCIALARVP